MTSLLNYNQISPEAYKALLALDKIVQNGSLPQNLRHLIRIRASQLNGCLFCLDMHVKEARRDDERELRLHHLYAWHESQLFSDREKAALEWTDALTAIRPVEDKEPLLEKLRQHFNDTEISEMTFTIGLINIWNRFGVAFKPVPGSLDKVFGLDKAGL
ncbi:carboxymuconolactone decarboxylase family protein [Oligoflexus tunisiensis]|uniref:carboxymuconolactone decarboxylase family protein n=1 Tax=Oligoflexus tunisiensis TaxID=708132 RepID=UPI000A70DC0D|nr:carboxymuconolactone decarboxylase family protein [Oligoflexus tunisiensis]